ncbi:beta-lactamase regulating signal transducer with metallopeptidase domain [Gillisia mitskevichiae]|uniref:Beta-lactamase regulating signal transducer with metallopeptidase domain n=1 Tax=Gillisia mitskevichiae TaxID=270921 RepID=A0A495P762_9FLAO|nr:M56 family metallopeptidase [Gillisia mitskevichiae]RKS45052.1 beta-lactamase regulating signal transducer with metallopeptidase domain [Gillisia mitskevichiae]
MESLLVYILKSAGLISLFYILYIVMLKNDTSFIANRKFLLIGIFTSAVLPVIYFTRKVFINVPETIYTAPSINSNLVTTQESPETNWWTIVGIFYVIITVFFLLRFSFRIFQILKMIHFSKIHKEEKFKFIKTPDKSGPFSFFKYIFINPENIEEDEIQLMLTHEKVHARQFHSIDMLFSNFITAVLWFNPISWYYKKAVEQNLEFIADSETAKASGCIQEYQHVLVKVSTNQYQNVLVNHFYQSFIKKRILMLNKKSSSRSNISKMSLIFPLLLAFMLTFNVKTEAQVKRVSKVVLDHVQFYPDELASAIITKNSTKEQLEEVVREFEKQGVELKFKKLKFSKEGLLTRINIKYEIEKSGQSGNFNKNGDAPIDDIEIRLSEDFNIEFRSKPSTNEINEFIIVKNSKPITIDSITKDKNIIWKTNLADGTMEEVTFTTPSNASFKVGNKVHYFVTEFDSISGKGQVINVNSKGGNRITWIEKDSVSSNKSFKIADSMQVYNLNKKESKNVKVISDKKGDYIIVIDGEVMPKNFKADKIPAKSIKYVNVLKGEVAVAKYGKTAKGGAIEMSTKSNLKNTKRKAPIVHVAKSAGSNNTKFVFENANEIPLIYIDDEIQKEDFDLNSIDPKTIESMMVLKSDAAVKEYGEKAENGVIKITLKKE